MPGQSTDAARIMCGKIFLQDKVCQRYKIFGLIYKIIAGYFYNSLQLFLAS